MQYADTAEEAASSDDLNAHMLCRSVRARLLARRGELAAADRLSHEAVDLAAQTDWTVDHADTLVARAEVQRAAGERNVAIVRLRDALALYELKHTRPPPNARGRSSRSGPRAQRDHDGWQDRQ